MATTIFTDYGQQLITEAIANKTTINITKIAVGDGMGAVYTPISSQTALKRETWSGPIDSVQVNPTNKNQVTFEGIVGANVGGFYIREIGLYDQANKLVAISDFPESFKALADQYELYVRMILQTGSADVTNIIVSKDMIYATKKYVDTETAKKYSKPTSGIPKTDLTAAVQTSLEKADEAAPTTELTKTNQALTTHKADLVSHGLYGTATGTNTLVMTNSKVTEYVEGMLVAFKNTTANTDTVSLNINSLGAKTVKKANGNALTSGNLKAGGIYQLRYDGSSFILLGEGGEYGTALASDVRKTKTFGTDNGVVQGTLDLTNLIASNIKKGVTIDGVTGSVDIASLGGKNYASGTAIVPSGAKTFKFAMSTGTFNNRYIQVTGLTFRPSVVVILGAFSNTGIYETLYRQSSDGYYSATVSISFYNQANGSTTLAEGNSNDAYVSYTGFLLPVGMGTGNTVYWQAFG